MARKSVCVSADAVFQCSSYKMITKLSMTADSCFLITKVSIKKFMSDNFIAVAKKMKGQLFDCAKILHYQKQLKMVCDKKLIRNCTKMKEY